MPPITLYTTPTCGYCHAAKRLLTAKGASFHEINVAVDPSRRAEMVKRARGRHTVPQIFIGERHIGGFDDMHALERAGELDPLLSE